VVERRETTGADGRCAFEGLPAMPSFSFVLSQPGGLPQSPREAPRPALEPGRRASVTWVHESGVSVVAVARTPDGRPLGPVQVSLRSVPYWTAEANATYAGRVLTWESFGESRTSLRKSTDESGRVVFEGVPIGWSLIGASDERYPEIVVPIRVGSETSNDEIELVLQVCEVRGRVLSPDGEQVPLGSVSWRGVGVGLDLMRGGTRADEDGFSTGPLLPGEYRFEAMPDDDPYQRSSIPLVVACPTDPIEIRLRRAGQARGIVVDPKGALVEGSVRAAGGWSADIEEGTFVLSQLAGGPHDLIAWDDEGRIGMLQGVRITEGRTIEGIVIPVAESAGVQVVTRGEQRSSMLVVLEWNGIELERTHASSSNEVLDLLAPPGDIEVRWLTRRPLGSYELEHVERRTVTAGATVTVQYDAP
jgi:hypothetical protein